MKISRLFLSVVIFGLMINLWANPDKETSNNAPVLSKENHTKETVTPQNKKPPEIKAETTKNEEWTDNLKLHLKNCVANTLEKNVAHDLQQCVTDKLASVLTQVVTQKTPQELQQCLSKEGAKCATNNLNTCLQEKLAFCSTQIVQNLLSKNAQNVFNNELNKCLVEQKLQLSKPLNNCLIANSATNLTLVEPPVTTAPITTTTTHDTLTPPVANTATKNTYVPDIQKIVNRGELVVAMLGVDSPPFFFLNKENGELHGLDVKLANDIADKLGVKLRLDRSAKTFDAVVDLVAKNQVDIGISKLSRTLERSKRILFSDPYIIFHHGLLINRLKIAQLAQGKEPYEIIPKLSGKMAVIKGSSYVNYARQKFPNTQIVEYPSWQPDVVSAVLNGDVVAAYRDELEIKRAVFGNPEASLKVQTVVFKDTEDAISMAVNYENAHLLFWLNQYIRTLNLNLNADELLKTYPEVLN